MHTYQSKIWPDDRKREVFDILIAGKSASEAADMMNVRYPGHGCFIVGQVAAHLRPRGTFRRGRLTEPLRTLRRVLEAAAHAP